MHKIVTLKELKVLRSPRRWRVMKSERSDIDLVEGETL